MSVHCCLPRDLGGAASSSSPRSTDPQLPPAAGLSASHSSPAGAAALQGCSHAVCVCVAADGLCCCLCACAWASLLFGLHTQRLQTSRAIITTDSRKRPQASLNRCLGFKGPRGGCEASTPSQRSLFSTSLLDRVLCPRDAAKMTATGIAVGANKGHVVTKRDQAQRPSRRKGVSFNRCSGGLGQRQAEADHQHHPAEAQQQTATPADPAAGCTCSCST